MSQVKSFLEKVESDPSLGEKFAGLETNQDIVSFASGLGFSFTEEEYEKALEENLNLDKISGGAAFGSGPATCPYSTTT